MKEHPIKKVQDYQRFVEKQNYIHYMHQLSFVKILESVYGCATRNFVLDTGNKELGVSAMKCKSLMFGKKITSMPFGFYPPLLNSEDKKDHEKAISELIKLCKPDQYLEYKTFEILSDDFLKENEIHFVEPSVVSTLSLEDNYENQLKIFGKSLKQNLRTTKRKLVEQEIVLRESKNVQDLKHWYYLLVKLYRDKHKMIAQPFSLYKKMLSADDSEWGAKLFLAEKGGDILAGIFVISDEQHWEYSWAATDAKFSRLGLNTLLVDLAIQEAIQSGAKTFGFGSSAPSDEKLIYFKSRWGCTAETIKYYYWNHRPNAVDLEKDYSLIRSVFSLIPIPVLKNISEILISKLV